MLPIFFVIRLKDDIIEFIPELIINSIKKSLVSSVIPKRIPCNAYIFLTVVNTEYHRKYIRTVRPWLRYIRFLPGWFRPK